MHYWQNNLGLSDFYRHWFENPEMKGYQYSPGLIAGGDNIPDLNSVVMQANSVARFGIFMWTSGKSNGLLNATHLVRENGGGGVVWTHGLVEHPFEDRVNDYITTHPVSVIYQTDTWKTKSPFTRLKADPAKDCFPTGGHYYTTNSNEDLGPVVGFPLGVLSSRFEALVGNRAQNRDHTSLLMCCCIVRQPRQSPTRQFA